MITRTHKPHLFINREALIEILWIFRSPNTGFLFIHMPKELKVDFIGKKFSDAVNERGVSDGQILPTAPILHSWILTHTATTV